MIIRKNIPISKTPKKAFSHNLLFFNIGIIISSSHNSLLIFYSSNSLYKDGRSGYFQKPI